MNFDYARKFIQGRVKELLGVDKTPQQATKPALIKRLVDMGLTEPYDREQCNQIASAIVADVLKEQSALTVQDTAMVEEPTKIEAVEEGGIQPIDWQQELTGEPSDLSKEPSGLSRTN